MNCNNSLANQFALRCIHSYSHCYIRQHSCKQVIIVPVTVLNKSRLFPSSFTISSAGLRVLLFWGCDWTDAVTWAWDPQVNHRYYWIYLHLQTFIWSILSRWKARISIFIFRSCSWT